LIRALAAALSLSLVILLSSHKSAAQATGVPPEVQASLLSRLASYDRNFLARAGDVARVLIFIKPGSAKSDLSATVIRSALSKVDAIGGLPHEEVVVPFETATGLADRCRSEHAAIVYLTPGFDSDIEAVRAALDGIDVLSVGAVSSYVEGGIVLGFELESSRPKMLLNLAQAKRQRVEFKAEIIKLMKVVQ